MKITARPQAKSLALRQTYITGLWHKMQHKSKIGVEGLQRVKTLYTTLTSLEEGEDVNVI